MDGALVLVSGLRVRFARLEITPVPESSEKPLAEPTWWLAQLCLLRLGLVGVGEPNRSWCAALPAPRHAASVSTEQS